MKFWSLLKTVDPFQYGTRLATPLGEKQGDPVELTTPLVLVKHPVENPVSVRPEVERLVAVAAPRTGATKVLLLSVWMPANVTRLVYRMPVSRSRDPPVLLKAATSLTVELPGPVTFPPPPPAPKAVPVPATTPDVLT